MVMIASTHILCELGCFGNEELLLVGQGLADAMLEKKVWEYF